MSGNLSFSRLFASPLVQETDSLKTNKSSVDELTGEVLSTSNYPILEQALQSAQDGLKGLTKDADFNAKMNLAFGNDWNAEVFSNLVQEFAKGNFSQLPAIEILPSAAINGANGAFASVTNTIYLAKEFVEQNVGNPGAITSVLLEETGHFIDSKVNVVDAAGDEGDIFARVVEGKAISAGELLELKGEDDTAIVILDGKTTQIEQSGPFRGTVDAQVNVRSGPGTNFNVVSALNPGNSRTFDSVASGTTHWDGREQRDDNRWFRIQGTNNWVSAAFITGNPAFNGTVDAPVNVRSGPGTNFAIVDGLSTGNSRTFDGVNVGTNHWDQREGRDENRWFRLQGTDRWVSAAFITGEPNNNQTPSDNAGNSTSSARNIGTLNSTQSFGDFVGSADTNDYYRFSLSNNSNFSLSLNGLSADADVQLLDSNGSQIQASTKSGTTAESITRTLNAGTYFVRVYPYSSANTNYNLNLTATAIIPSKPDIDIQLFYPNGGFTQSEINLMEKAAQNWERIITKDKDSSGILKISVLKELPSSPNFVAQAIQDTAYNYRNNFSSNYSGKNIDINGVDYHNNIRFNPNDFSRMVNTNALVRLAMHEIGHTLGLDHEAGVSLMNHLYFNAKMTDSMYNTMTAQGYNVDRNVLINWS